MEQNGILNKFKQLYCEEQKILDTKYCPEESSKVVIVSQNKVNNANFQNGY